jgi:hypothetical protein
MGAHHCPNPRAVHEADASKVDDDLLSPSLEQILDLVAEGGDGWAKHEISLQIQNGNVPFVANVDIHFALA